MRWPIATILVGSFLLFAVAPEARADEPIAVAEIKRDTPVNFESEILPVLKRSCIACHNATEAEGGLNLETPELMLKGGDSGAAVVPKNGAESLLLGRATGAIDSIMPPEDNKSGAKPLTPDELGLLKLWIDQGATGTVSAAKQQVEWQPLPPGIHPIYAVAVTSDGQFAACNRANQVFLYHLPTGREVCRLTDPALLESGVYNKPGVADFDLIQSLAFSPDGSLLATGGYRTVKLWQRPVSEPVRVFAGAVEGNSPVATVSPDGRVVATALAGGKIGLFDLASGKKLPALQGHGKPMVALQFSADGKQLLSVAGDGTARLATLNEKKPGTRWLNCGGEPTGAVWLTAGNQVAIALADGAVRVFAAEAFSDEPDDEPAQPVQQWSTGDKPVTALAAAGGKTPHLVTAAGDVAAVWDAATGKKARDLKHGAAITALAVNPAGEQIATSGGDNRTRLWNTADGKQLAETQGDARLAHQVALAERTVNIAKLLVAAEKTAVEEAEKAVKTEADAVKKAEEAVATAKKALDEKMAASKKAAEALASAQAAAADARQKLEMAQTELPQAQQAEEKSAAAVKSAEAKLQKAQEAQKQAQAKQADDAKDDKPKAETAEKGVSDQLAAAVQQASQALKKAQATADKAKQRTADLTKAVPDLEKALKAADDKVTAAQKPADEANTAQSAAEMAHTVAARALASAQAAQKRAEQRVPVAQKALKQAEAQVAQAETEREAATKHLADAARPARSLAFSAAGDVLAAVGDDGLLRTWRAADLSPGEVYPVSDKSVGWVAWGANDQLVVADGTGQLSVRPLLAEWTLVRVIGNPNSDDLADRVTAIDFSPDGRLLATGSGSPSRSGELKLWNLADGSLVRELVDAHSDTVFTVRFSPDGAYLASGAADKFIKVFQVSDGEFVRAFEGHTHHVLGVDWQADGRVLASCGADAVVKVWDVLTGDQKRTITGFGKEVTSVRFIAESANIVSSCGDKNVRLHQTGDGRAVRSFAGATDFVFSVVPSSDGKRVVAGGHDGVLRVWNADDAKELAKFAAP